MAMATATSTARVTRQAKTESPGGTSWGHRGFCFPYAGVTHRAAGRPRHRLAAHYGAVPAVLAGRSTATGSP
jgi:hypothetical protein